MRDWTVIDLLRERGVRPHKRVTWGLGVAIREAWRQTQGAPPEKVLREKTSGRGSHCLAVYPEWFRSHGQAVVDEVVRAEARQPSLFCE